MQGKPLKYTIENGFPYAVTTWTDPKDNNKLKCANKTNDNNYIISETKILC